SLSSLNPFRNPLSGLALVAALCLGSASARADQVQLNVACTGMNVNAQGVDQRYRLMASADPANTGSSAYAVQQLAPNWLANQAGSKWIAPRADESYAAGQAIGKASVGGYIYETHFTVPANALLSTGTITGNLAVDNQLNDSVLNGKHLNISTPRR